MRQGGAARGAEHESLSSSGIQDEVLRTGADVTEARSQSKMPKFSCLLHESLGRSGKNGRRFKSGNALLSA